MKISLVIPAYNEEKLLGKCLDAALAQELPFHEIIVVDNASTDRTFDIAFCWSESPDYRPMRVVREPRKGLPYARQRGFETTTGDIIAYCDADTELPPDWSWWADTHFECFSSVVCVSNPTTYPELPRWKQLFVKWIWWNGISRITHLITERMFNGGCFAIRRETLEQMGGIPVDSYRKDGSSSLGRTPRKIDFYGEDAAIAKAAHKFGRLKFLFDLEVPASARRFEGQGFFKTATIYALNFWGPFTKSHQDYR